MSNKLIDILSTDTALHKHKCECILLLSFCQVVCQLPSYKSTVTAMTFTPDNQNLITAYADQKVAAQVCQDYLMNVSLSGCVDISHIYTRYRV